MERLCPFNNFSPCKGEQCAVSIKVEEEWTCSISMIGHEVFILADLKLQEQQTKQEAIQCEVH